jgi:hypothetical protein
VARFKQVAIPAGLEPATRGVEIRYSIQLSYGTVAMSPAVHPALGYRLFGWLSRAGRTVPLDSTVNRKNPLSRKGFLRTYPDEHAT